MKMEEKISRLEREVNELKIMVMQQNSNRKLVSLKGALRGLKFDDEDIEKAKKSLFKSR